MRRRRNADEVARLLREADRDLAKGLTISDICRKQGIAETTYYRWRQRHAPDQVDSDRRCRAEFRHLPGRAVRPAANGRGDDVRSPDPFAVLKGLRARGERECRLTARRARRGHELQMAGLGAVATAAVAGVGRD